MTAVSIPGRGGELGPVLEPVSLQDCKGGVKSPCALTEHHAMKAYWGSEVQLRPFSTSAPDGGEWAASRPGRFNPGERAPGIQWIGGWVCPRAALDAVAERQIPSP
jgi:hypothetical protein